MVPDQLVNVINRELEIGPERGIAETKNMEIKALVQASGKVANMVPAEVVCSSEVVNLLLGKLTFHIRVVQVLVPLHPTQL